MLKHFLNPPNWFTAASLFCSSYAMMSVIAGALQGDGGIDAGLLSRACILIVVGGVFDLLDGRVARLTGRFSEFGVQLDSIADIVGFGVAPSLLAWAWLLHDFGPFGVAACVWYVIAAAFRLARFNVGTVEKSWHLAGHSQGLTSTMSGGALVSFIWIFNGYLGHISVPPSFVAFLVALLGLLMVSSYPFRTFRDLRQNRVARRLLAASLTACLLGAVLIDPSMWWGVGAALYLVGGLIDGLVVAAQQRALRRALFVDEIEEALAEAFAEYDDETNALRDEL